MATSVTLNGSVTLDESALLQIGEVPLGAEDNNDNDVNVADLPTAFTSALPGGLQFLGAAKSADNLITVTADGAVVSLGFTTTSGAAVPVYGSGQAGAPGGLFALNGGAISLFASNSALGNRVVLGVDGSGDIVFALYMEPNATLTAAAIWMAQFEPLANPIAGNPDDPLLVGGLGVAAGSALEFDFNALPSGQNLFGTVGTTDSGLVVIGKTVALKADGTFTNASNTINTSQGGGPTTIGVNNQMFDPGDGAYFTLVRDPVANYLSGAPGGLDQNEADDADNIQYSGGTIEVNSSFTTISQIQGNAAATMKITAFNINGAPQGTAFTSALGSGTQVNIIEVKVNGVVVTADLTGNSAIVSGLKAGDKVEWVTDGVHDQVLIEGVAGKFDIGGFGALQSQPSADQRLDFVVQVVDGDGDHYSDGFSIGIDGTGINDDGVVVGIVGVP